MTPTVQARDAGALGGNGGAEFRATCRTNDVLIGINMRSGKALDALAAICIETNAQRTEWSGKAYEAARDNGNYYGGAGGAYQKIACSPGFAVTHLHVFMDGLGAVNHAIITCRDLDAATYEDFVPGQIDGASVADQRIQCQDNEEFGSGLYGRYGALIDKLGLQCAKLSKPAAPTAETAPTPAGSAFSNEPQDFAGTWNTVTGLKGSFKMILKVDGNSVSGRFENTSNPEYNGSINGNVKTGFASDNGPFGKFNYESTQTGIDVAGKGSFKVTADGKLVGGFIWRQPGKNKDTYISWNGTKASNDDEYSSIELPGGGGSTGGGGTGSENEDTTTDTQKTKRAVDLFNGPKKGKKVGSVPKGTLVAVDKCRKNGMCHITSKRFNGWIYDGDDYDTLDR